MFQQNFNDFSVIFDYQPKMKHFLAPFFFSLLLSATLINQTNLDPSISISYTSQFSRTNHSSTRTARGTIFQNLTKIGEFEQTAYKQTTITKGNSSSPLPGMDNHFLQMENSVDVQELYRSIQYMINPVHLITTSFSEFIRLYDKSYKNLEEYSYREQVYYQNCKKMNQFNLNPNRLFNMGINQFTDLEEGEFQSTYATLFDDPSLQIQSSKRNLQIADPPPLPPLLPNITVSWKCFVGPVVHQGFCGSCYAFSCADAVATLYTLYDPQTTFHMRLSVQELISCNEPILEDGCKGGLFEHTYEYIKKNGLTTELNYPYDSAYSRQPPKCNYEKANSSKKRKISSYRRINPDCADVLQVLKSQPLAVGISSQKLQFYSEGVYEQSQASITDHAVLLIGYHPIKGFEIKNMWGRAWGLLGYGWVSYIHNAGICSRAMEISLPEEMTSSKNQCS